MAAGKENSDAQQADCEAADDVVARRYEVRATPARNRDDQQSRDSDTGKGRDQTAPSAEIVRRQDRINSTERKK